MREQGTTPQEESELWAIICDDVRELQRRRIRRSIPS